MSRPTQKSLLNSNSGIWSSKLDGRIDLERYSYACRQLENFLIRPHGTADRRPGTEYIRHTKANGFALVWEFQYSTTVGYIIEVGESYLRFYEDGAQVTSSLGITASSWAGGTATFTTASNHNLAIDDHVVVTGMTPSGYNVADARVTGVPAANQFEIPIATDPGGVGSVFGAVAQPLELVTPYLEEDLRDIQYRQINDIVYLTHKDYQPYILRRLSTTPTFDIAPVTYHVPPFRDENVSQITIKPTLAGPAGTSITLDASAPLWVTGTYYEVGQYRRDVVASPYEIYICLEAHTSGVFATDLAAGKWELVSVFYDDSGPPVRSNIGGYYRLGHKRPTSSTQIFLADAPPLTTGSSGQSTALRIKGTWNFRTTGRWAGTVKIQRESIVLPGTWETIREAVVNDADRNIDIVGEEPEEANLRIDFTVGTLGTAGQERPVAYLEAAESYLYGYCKVTAIASNIQATATVIDSFLTNGATDIWAESSWSDRRGWPRTCDIHEQHVVYGGNIDQPLTVWGSRLGDFQNFLWGVNDDDAFTYSIPSTEQNPIEWIVGGKSILIGNGKEYGIMSSGSDDLPITPTNAVYRVQEAVGFSSLKPRIIGPIFAGVERNGRKLREIAYKFDEGVSGGYRAADLNRLNDEITSEGILDIAYAQQREPYIYAVVNSGELGVLAYNRDDAIVGWSKFTAGATGNDEFESVAILRGTYEDEVYFVVERSIDGTQKRFVERLYSEEWDINDAPRDAYFVDCGIQTTTAIEILSAAWAGDAATYTTDGDHGLQVGDLVDVTFVTPVGYNVTNKPIIAVPASDEFSVLVAPDPGAYSADGTVHSNRVVGLEHLAGETVAILGDGSPQPDAVVDANGEVSLNTVANKVKAGISYQVVYEPMRLDIDSLAGSSQGHKKIISEINLRVHKSVGCSLSNGIVTDLFPFNDTDDLMDVAVPLFTGEKRINWASTFGPDPDANDPKMIISQTQPLPFTIVAIVVKYRIS